MTDMRTYQREYARTRREKAVAAKNAAALRCQGILANQRPCKTLLQSRFVNGQTVPFCPTCDRKARGVCVECGVGPVMGTARKGLYCALHQKLAKHAAYAQYRKTNRRKMVAKELARMADPVKHADRLEYKRLNRKSRPLRTAAYKKAYNERHAEKVRAYHVEYRAKHAEMRRERERQRLRGTLPERACLTCSTIVTGRAKRCDACKRAEREHARRVLTERIDRAA